MKLEKVPWVNHECNTMFHENDMSLAFLIK